MAEDKRTAKFELEVKGVKEGKAQIDALKESIRKLKEATGEAAAPTEKVSSAFDGLSAVISGFGKVISVVSGVFTAFSTTISAVTGVLGLVGSVVVTVASGFATLAGVLGKVVVGAAQRLFGVFRELTDQVITTSTEFERLKIRLDTVFRSAAEGDRVFAWVKNLALETPFTVAQLTDMATSLKAVNIDPRLERDGVSILTRISDLAAGMGRSLTDAFFSFKEAAAEGNFISLMRRFSLTKRSIDRTLSEAGVGVDFSTVEGRIDALTKFIELRFGGASKALANSFAGIANRIEDVTQQIMVSIGDAGLFDATKKGLSDIADILVSKIGTGEIAAIGQTISGIITPAVEKLRDLLLGIIARVNFKGVFENISAGVKVVTAQVEKVFNFLTSDAVVGAVSKALDTAISKVVELYNITVKLFEEGGFSAIFDSLLREAQPVIDKVFDLVLSGGKAVIDELGEWYLNRFRNTLGISRKLFGIRNDSEIPGVENVKVMEGQLRQRGVSVRQGRVSREPEGATTDATGPGGSALQRLMEFVTGNNRPSQEFTITNKLIKDQEALLAKDADRMSKLNAEYAEAGNNLGELGERFGEISEQTKIIDSRKAFVKLLAENMNDINDAAKESPEAVQKLVKSLEKAAGLTATIKDDTSEGLVNNMQESVGIIGRVRSAADQVRTAFESAESAVVGIVSKLLSLGDVLRNFGKGETPESRFASLKALQEETGRARTPGAKADLQVQFATRVSNELASAREAEKNAEERVRELRRGGGDFNEIRKAGKALTEARTTVGRLETVAPAAEAAGREAEEALVKRREEAEANADQLFSDVSAIRGILENALALDKARAQIAEVGTPEKIEKALQSAQDRLSAVKGLGADGERFIQPIQNEIANLQATLMESKNLTQTFADLFKGFKAEDGSFAKFESLLNDNLMITALKELKDVIIDRTGGARNRSPYVENGVD